jgi:hypothetical protein
LKIKNLGEYLEFFIPDFFIPSEIFFPIERKKPEQKIFSEFLKKVDQSQKSFPIFKKGFI